MIRRLLPALLSLLLTVGCVDVQPRQSPPPPPPLPLAKDYSRELPEGEMALKKVPWPDLRGALHDRVALAEQVERSLNYLRKASSQGFFPRSGVSHERTQESLQAFRDLLVAPISDGELLAELRRKFDCWSSVGCDGDGTVLFTGYYTPVFAGSLEPNEVYRFPLHSPPAGHKKDPKTGATIGLVGKDGKLQRDYPTRKELADSGQLDGLELVWLADPFEAYVAQVQGSAIIRLRDGSMLEVGYAGTNGKEYFSIGQELVRQGKLSRDELSLQKLLQFFRDHPEELEPLLAMNERYVFFQEAPGGPFGCINERVVPLLSVATDKSLFPRGALCLVEADLPGTRGPGWKGFALDQDAGGAIRAPGRCDVYMGVGDEAGELAGRTWAEGRLFYILLKEEPTEVSSKR